MRFRNLPFSYNRSQLEKHPAKQKADSEQASPLGSKSSQNDVLKKDLERNERARGNTRPAVRSNVAAWVNGLLT